MARPAHFLPRLAGWIPWAYGMLAFITLPWTVYLGVTLPSRHLSRHWDAAWVGLDIGIFLGLLLTAILASLRSKWLVISATFTSTLLLVDAWFDILTSRPGGPQTVAILEALFIELPLVILTFRIAQAVLDLI